MTSRPEVRWQCGRHTLVLGSRTLVMGILNCTPDSFSDGGRFMDVDAAVDRGLQMVDEGAAVVDVGGESTRPGAEAVSVEEEKARVLPVIERLASSVVISVDTSKAPVAEAALQAGASIINDVTAGTADPAMFELAASTSAGLVLMHMKGNPRTMQKEPVYGDVVGDVADYLAARCDAALAAGCQPGQLCLDPGIGFGKTVAHNLQLLRGTNRLRGAGYPVLIGASRKSFIGALTGGGVGDRLAGSLAVATFVALAGAEMIRVHDVKESCDAVCLADMLCRDERPPRTG